LPGLPLAAAPAAPLARLTSVVSVMAARATRAGSESITSSSTAIAVNSREPKRIPRTPAPPLMIREYPPPLTARTSHAHDHSPALERDRRVLRARLRPVDHVHEAPALPGARLVAGGVHRVIRAPLLLHEADDSSLCLRAREA